MTRKWLVLSTLLGVAAAALPVNAQIITKVARRNPVTASADTEPALASKPLAEKSPAMVDRTHVYADVPAALLGAQYVMLANDDKNNANMELYLTFGQSAILYVFIDNRLGTGTAGKTTVPNLAGGGMAWVTTMGFVDTGMDIGIDESADGSINNYYSVFSKQVTAGEVVLKGQNDPTGSRNMYGVAAMLPHFKAYTPIPADGQTNVEWPVLQWTPGITAVAHNVYLGTSPELGPADLVGPKTTGVKYVYTPGFTPGVTYYWRVDEIEKDLTTIHTGDVWSFRAVSPTAYDPVPANEDQWVDPNVTLSWKPGSDALGHDVYFGTDRAAVESASAAAFQATIYETFWTPPTLRPDTTYFWRVDEVNVDDGRQAGPVWSFETVRTIPITDPHLLAWWKMDEEAGTTAADWSGHNRHLRFATPAPTWDFGMFGGALQFPGNGESAVCADGSFLNGLTALTITAWVKSDVKSTDRGIIVFQTPTGGDSMDLRYDGAGSNGGGTNVLKMAVTVSVDGTNTTLPLESSNDSASTDWQFLTLVWSSGQPLAFYLNGKLDVPTDNAAAVAGTLAGFSTVIVGKGGKDNSGSSSWDGLIDEIRLYDKALTPAEIEATMRGDPLLAWSPSPANGASVDALHVVPLTWNAGDGAVQHDVYLGTDRAAVAAATVADTTGLYRGRVTDTSFTPDPALELGRTYYWRVDEISNDGTVNPGFVWSFLLLDYLIVDDFESYTGDIGDEIFATWLDNYDLQAQVQQGAQVGVEDVPFVETRAAYVHGGKQSMPLSYNNAGPKYFVSETERTFDDSWDWTDYGMTDLVLYFRGLPVNFLESAPGAITLSGGGTDIFNTADQGRLAWKSLTGDGTIIVKVESVDNTNGWAKAGVMIRETLDAGSRFAGVYATPSNGVRFQARAMTDASATSDTNATPAPSDEQKALKTPVWIKLERTGNDFKGSYSTDGTTWTPMSWGAQTIAMQGTVYIGVVVTSHNTDTSVLCTAQFSNITITGGFSGAWQATDLGVTQPGNTREDLYVAVGDSAGKVAVVPNDDLAAVNATMWTEWRIPLSRFTGISLTKVKKMYIGIGDRDNPSAGGHGQIFIDDIRLVQSK